METRFDVMAIVTGAALLACGPAGAQTMEEQLALRAPMAPTVFESGGRQRVLYELHLTNFRPASPQAPADFVVKRIEVIDAAPGGKTVAVFEGEALDRILQPLAGRGPAGVSDIAPGATVVAFLSVEAPAGGAMPARLRHHVVLANSEVDGAVVGTRTTELKVLAPPVRGSRWLAADAPDNTPDNHHGAAWPWSTGRR